MSNKKPSKLILLLISLVSLIAVGCGDSREEYVFTGTAPTATVGNLTFQFDQAATAQQAGLVPAGTTSLQFRFYANTTANDTDLVYEATAPYADSVTVENVPNTAVFVRVTAYGANGVPLAVLTGNFRVIAGATVPVDLSTPTAVTFDSIGVSPDAVTLTLGTNGNDSAQLTIVGNFSNVQSVTFPASSFAANAEFTSSNPAVAAVSTTGLIEAVSNGTAVITTEYSLNGISRTDTTTVTVTGGIVNVNTLEITPSTLTLPAGSSSANLTATFTAAGSNTTADVSSNVTYTSSAAGITVDNETNQVVVAANVTAGTTATVTGTYTTGNVTVSDTVNVTVGQVFILDVSTLSGSVYRFPSGTTFTPFFVAELSDGNSDVFTSIQSLSNTTYDVTLTSSNTTAVTVVNGNLALNDTTGNTTATVTATIGNFTAANGNFTETLTVTNLDVDTYSVDVTATPTTLEVDDEGTYTIVINYGGSGSNVTQDITLFSQPVATPDILDFGFDFETFTASFTAIAPGTTVLSSGGSTGSPFFTLGGTPTVGQTATITVTGQPNGQ